MGTAERRLEILKYLCRKRHSTVKELSEMFGVSVRTIQRDIFEIEFVFHVPLEIKSGRYGGIYVIGNYSFDRMYMSQTEIDLLVKIKLMVKSNLDTNENRMLDYIIDTYRKPKNLIW